MTAGLLRKILYLAAVALLLGPPVRAQEDITSIPLEDLAQVQVYSASRYLQKTIDAPAAITIVTADDIRYFGYRTLAEVMANVRDFYVSNDRNYSYVGLRGFARPGDFNTRILLLVDGHRINDPIYDQGQFDNTLPVPLDAIDRIEIVRGPTSSLYGTNAMLGVINVITRRGSALNGTRVSVEGGALGTYGSTITVGRTFKNGTDLLFSVSGANSNGQQRVYFPEFDTPGTNNGIAVGLDGQRARSMYFSVAHKGLAVRGAYGTRLKFVPTASYGADFNVRENTSDKTGYVDLSYDRTIRRWDLHAHAAYDSYSYDGLYNYSGEPTYLDYGRAKWWTWDVLASPRILEQHKIQVGADFRYATRRAQFSNWNDVPSLRLTNPFVWGAFVEDEFRVHRKLSLTGGLRFDDLGGPTALSPRVAVVYKPVKSTALKFLAGSAFRAPNAYEQSYYELQRTLPRLYSEKLTSFEFIVEHYVGNDLRLTLSAFRNSFDDLITETGTSNELGFVNSVDFDGNGLSAEVEKRYHNGVLGRGSWTVQRTVDPNSHVVLSNSPVHVAKAALVVPLLRNRLDLGVTERAVSGVTTIYGTSLSAYSVTDLTLSSNKLWRTVEFSASLNNLFGNKILVPGAAEHVQQGIPQYGRTWHMKLSYRF